MSLKNPTRKENTVFTCYERLLKTIYYLFFPLQLSLQKLNIYRPQRSWGKVIFSQASVILSTGGRAWLWGGVWGVVAREHAWLPGGCIIPGGLCIVVGGMHGCGGCMVAGGLCVVLGMCAWLLGGMCGCPGGVYGCQAMHRMR